MPAHKRKPNYNAATTMQELIRSIDNSLIKQGKIQVPKDLVVR